MCVCVCACVRARVRGRVRACVCVPRECNPIYLTKQCCLPFTLDNCIILLYFLKEVKVNGCVEFNNYVKTDQIKLDQSLGNGENEHTDIRGLPFN